jgi:hypothetical protein
MVSLERRQSERGMQLACTQAACVEWPHHPAGMPFPISGMQQMIPAGTMVPTFSYGLAGEHGFFHAARHGQHGGGLFRRRWWG